MPDRFAAAWDVREFGRDVNALIALLGRNGLTISPESSLSKAAQDVREMVDRLEGRLPRIFTMDYRPAWRRIVGLADVSRKILAVEAHPDFAELNLS
jgi:hypothetical protein